jgi:protein-S-isoprenylcysteine O-methyltransferase Ste14
VQTSALTYASILWSALGLFWLISAIETKRATKRQSVASRLGQAIPVSAAFYLLFARVHWPWWLTLRFAPESMALEWMGVALTVAGIAFAVWARVFIGRNWSGTVTVKEQHELIQSGPYAIVRHPIYSGFLLAYLGTAIIEGQVRGLAGFALVLWGWGIKLRLEETFMTAQFGNAYSDYKKRVKALVPYVI